MRRPIAAPPMTMKPAGMRRARSNTELAAMAAPPMTAATATVSATEVAAMQSTARTAIACALQAWAAQDAQPAPSVVACLMTPDEPERPSHELLPDFQRVEERITHIEQWLLRRRRRRWSAPH